MKLTCLLGVLVIVVGAGGSPQAMRGQTRPAITGIAFVRMYSVDAAASDAFYGKTLGFEKVMGADGIARYGVNEAQWLEVEKLPANPQETRVAEVAFTTRDVKVLRRYLVAHHVAIEAGARKDQFSVRDPEGNLIGFVQRDALKGRLTMSTRSTSRRVIHAGFVVRGRAVEDAFYRDLLGFKPYWHGGRTDNSTDYVSLQVPDGTDWVEYMLNGGPHPSAHTLGVMNHFSLGVAHMSDATTALARNGCTTAECSKSQMGRDGKVQLNLYDPDLTRVEFMEFAPSGTTCCSSFEGRHPIEVEDR